MNVQPPQAPRQKIPKDGLGPRGVPDCYYTSRRLNSTFRYVRFVKKLRALEDEQRKWGANILKEKQDQQNSEFFIRCDRRSLINNVARRVDLCLASYEQDVQEKRKRLMTLLKQEEEVNIRKFVEQAQAGAESVWEDKKARLQYLLEKRKKEHAERYKDTPLSKCAHVLPCITKLRAKEAEEIQLYQMKEKQHRKMSEKEIDNMWYEIAMKESEALKARMEMDVIDRYRRDMECHKYSEQQLEERRRQRGRERERLKQESIYFRKLWDEDIRKEEEAERMRKEKRIQTGRERKEMIEERERKVAHQKEEERHINETWDSLTAQGLSDDRAKEELRRRKERDLDECNRRMIDLRSELQTLDSANDNMIEAEAQRQQEVLDGKRCKYLLWSQNTNREVRKAMIDQIKDRSNAREALKQRMAEEDEYHRQLFQQLEQLSMNKELSDAAERKHHQRDLVAQIEYNKLLKQRALQEEMDQRRKAELATEEYDREINRMLCRPFFSDHLNPFMQKMSKNLQLCPCSKRAHCSHK